MNGDTETGVTTFFLKHEIDTGDIISQERVEILPSDNVEDVHDRLMHLGARLTVNTVRAIADGTVTTIPQERMLTSGETPTPAPKIFKDTCRIDWYRPARQLHNHVRGLSPYPCRLDRALPQRQRHPRGNTQDTGHRPHRPQKLCARRYSHCRQRHTGNRMRRRANTRNLPSAALRQTPHGGRRIPPGSPP